MNVQDKVVELARLNVLAKAEKMLLKLTPGHGCALQVVPLASRKMVN